MRLSEMLNQRQAVLDDRKVAYNISKKLVLSGGGGFGMEVKEAAKRYLDAEDRSLPIHARIGAAQAMLKALDFEKRAATTVLKVVKDYKKGFNAALTELKASEKDYGKIRRP